MNKQYKALFLEVREIINKSDPIGLLKQGAPDDEYEKEVQEIIAGLNKCKNANQTQELIYRVFKNNFGENTVGNIELYIDAAKIIATLKNK